MLKFDLKPKPKHSFEVTRAKVVVSLLMFLGLVLIYKTYAYSRVEGQLFSLQTQNALSAMTEYSEEAMKAAFENANYCGWKITEAEKITLSDNYIKNLGSAPVLEQEVKAGGAKISLCMKKIEDNKSDVNSNVVGILLVLGIIYGLIRKDLYKDITQDKNGSSEEKDSEAGSAGKA